MSDKVLEAIEQIGKKQETIVNAVKDAQDRADLAGEKADAIDHDVIKKASEEAAKAAEEIQELRQKIDAKDKAVDYLEKAMGRLGGSASGESESKELEAKAREEMSRYLRKGDEMSPEVIEGISRAMVEKNLVGLDDRSRENEVKDLVAGSNPDGGYFIRPQRAAKMIERIFETSPMRSIASIETTNSDSLEFLIDDDEAESGGWVGETDSRGDSGTPQVGKLTIVAHEQFAQPKATQKMLDDAGFDIEGWLNRKVTNKMTRVENTSFVVGDGSQKPRGFLALPAWSNAGVYERGALEQINSGTAGEFTGDGVKNLQNAVKEPYQAGSNWVIRRSAWASIITLKDSNNRYLLNQFELSGLSNQDSLNLLGKPVVFFDDMPDVAADALALAYGNFNVGYTIVDRIGFRVIRDNLTAKPYIKFYTTKRTGGDVTNYESIKIQKLSA